MADYEPWYVWRPTYPGETGLDGKPLQNFVGLDGDVNIGVIRLEEGGKLNGQWQWNGQGPHVRQRLIPHQGYCSSAREAARKVEDYYHRLMRHNGLRGSKDQD